MHWHSATLFDFPLQRYNIFSNFTPLTPKFSLFHLFLVRPHLPLPHLMRFPPRIHSPFRAHARLRARLGASCLRSHFFTSAPLSRAPLMSLPSPLHLPCNKPALSPAFASKNSRLATYYPSTTYGATGAPGTGYLDEGHLTLLWIHRAGPHPHRWNRQRP